MGVQTEKTYHRILALELGNDCLDINLIDLMAEYIRRMSVICQQNPSFFEKHPFFDLAEKIDPGARADAAMVLTVRNHTAMTVNVWTPRICEWALHFAALQDKLGDQLTIKSPYEPLIKIFELEGDFIVKSEIWMCGSTMSLSAWREKVPLSLEPIVDLGD
jgi:hypothetical protein